MNKFIALLLILSQTALAGLPPTTMQGQSDTSPTTKFAIQAPLSQFTDLGGIKGLIETGNANIVKNPGAEGTGNLPVAFADGASVNPVALTGGSPNTTCTRTTSSPLDGTGSFLMTVTTGASRQGEGCAWTVTLPGTAAYRSHTLSLSFSYATTGTLVDGDVQIYAYDITNSLLITPNWRQKVIGTTGVAIAEFPTQSTTASLRFALYLARTSTAALTVTTDDMVLVPTGPNVTGVQATDAIAYTPTITTGFGTVTGLVAYYSRVGDRLKVWGSAAAGTTSAASVAITLPAGLAIDSTKQSSTQAVGRLTRTVNTAAWPAVTVGPWFLSYDGSTTGSVFFSGTATTSGNFAKSNGSTFLNTGENFEFAFEVPIAGWSSTQNIATSQVFNISQYLAAGSRVTGSAPTALGQYRSYLRTGSTSNTFSETNGTPTAVPSAADGMKLYSSGTYAATDSSGQPSKYDIFIGVNKSYQMLYWTSTGHPSTYIMSSAPAVYSSTVDNGVQTFYDSKSGILTVEQFIGGETNCHLYRDGATNGQDTMFFDIVVSDNPVGVGAGTPTSARYYSSASSISGSLGTVTYATKDYDDALMCSSGVCTIPTGAAGKYQINAGLLVSGTFALNSTTVLEIQKNSSVITRNKTYAGGAITNGTVMVSDTVNLVAGDTIRIQASTSATGPAVVSDNFANFFSMTRLSN